jgi:hypothetical protein
VDIKDKDASVTTLIGKIPTFADSGKFPPKPKDMPEEVYNNICKKLASKFTNVYTKFLAPGSTNLVALPSQIVKPLIEFIENNVYSPDIFTRAYEYFAKSIELRAWNHYQKSIESITNGKIEESNDMAKEVGHPSYTIRQIVNDDLSPPFSYNDFHEYLKKNVMLYLFSYAKKIWNFYHLDTSINLHPCHYTVINIMILSNLQVCRRSLLTTPKKNFKTDYQKIILCCKSLFRNISFPTLLEKSIYQCH